MLQQLLAGATLFVVSLAPAGIQRGDQQINDQFAGIRDHRLQTLVAKLKLTDLQSVEVGAILAAYDKKIEPVQRQLLNLHLQEREALLNVLNKEQHAMLPDVLREARHKELGKIASELKVTAEQRLRLERVCDEFGQRFNQLIQEKSHDLAQFQKLGHEAFAAIRGELNEEQRAKLPAIMREEFREWHEPATLREHIQAVGEKLNLSIDQNDQIQKVLTDFERKFAEPTAQLKQLRHDEWAAVEMVLTTEQRMRLHEMLKGHDAR